MARIRVVEWQNYIATEIHKSFTPLFRRVEGAEREFVVADLIRKLTFVSEQLKGKSYLTGDVLASLLQEGHEVRYPFACVREVAS
jgi:glutathione S-transferase